MERIELSELETKEIIHSRESIVQVRRVKHKVTEKEYCTKEIFTLSIDEASKKLQEIVAMAKLSHENIASIRSCRLSGKYSSINSIIIIMDYYPEGDLENLIKFKISNNIKWPEPELYYYLIKLIDALSFMQSQSICHRDIKPQNILIDKSGENINFILADFGVSRHYVDGNSSIAGSTPYLSPEVRKALIDYVIEGKYTVDHNPFKSDVYSLGLVFLYMASLKKNKSLENLSNLQQATDERIQELEQEYPNFSKILKQMLEIEQTNRPDFEGMKVILEKNNIYGICQICLKIKFLNHLFKYNRNESLCIDCLQKVQVFESEKLVCETCRRFLNENGGCDCIAERCLICKREKHINLTCAGYEAEAKIIRKKVFYVCCKSLLSIIEGNTWFYCGIEGNYYCLVCLKKYKAIHRECLVRFNYIWDPSTIVSSKSRSL